MILCARRQRRHRHSKILDSVGKGEDGMILETSIETYILPYVTKIPVEV